MDVRIRPLARGREHLEATMGGTPARAVPGSQGAVLVIEDDDAVREALLSVLELDGYRVASASNGREGLEALAGDLHPCAIVLDLMMPVMDGWAFLDALHADAALASIPVVVVTAFSEAGDTVRGHPVVRKPLDLAALTTRLAAYCGGEPQA